MTRKFEFSTTGYTALTGRMDLDALLPEALPQAKHKLPLQGEHSDKRLKALNTSSNGNASGLIFFRGCRGKKRKKQPIDQHTIH